MKRGKKSNNLRFTPDPVVGLAKDEIFVFGSNTDGKHWGGAARVAEKEFGAEVGVAEGLTGRCYALPTVSFRSQFVLRNLKTSVVKFIKVAKNHPNLVFIVTEVGCGIAGFDPKEVAPLFKATIKMDNVILPKKFYDIIMKKNEKK